MLIESMHANFLVNETGLRVQIDDGTIIEFYEGDGITIVNRDDIPHLEFKINDNEISVKIEAREDFESILENVRHMSEFVTKDVELMEAMADENIPTADIMKSFGETHSAQKNKTRINLPITTEVKTLTTEEKVKYMAHVESTFRKPTIGSLISVSEAPDPAAPGAKPANLSANLDSDEEDDPNDLSSTTGGPKDSASGTVDTGDSTATGNQVAEGDDKDDDDMDDDDKDEGKKKK